MNVLTATSKANPSEMFARSLQEPSGPVERTELTDELCSNTARSTSCAQRKTCMTLATQRDPQATDLDEDGLDPPAVGTTADEYGRVQSRSGHVQSKDGHVQSKDGHVQTATV